MRFIKDFCEDERNCSPGQKNRKRKKEKDEGEKSELTLSNKSFPLYNDKAVHWATNSSWKYRNGSQGRGGGGDLPRVIWKLTSKVHLDII